MVYDTHYRQENKCSITLDPAQRRQYAVELAALAPELTNGVQAIANDLRSVHSPPWRGGIFRRIFQDDSLRPMDPPHESGNDPGRAREAPVSQKPQIGDEFTRAVGLYLHEQ